ncbi:NUDIX hydrolase [Streptomyces sp. Ru71]|uniref:NUDIX domain-containing protein n=1 Tax=Streptomyces sp. Ru71 TaxID=2080746 RepID=UPI000CDD319E|nr:NUDIX hydrolase [Streptomyces sp. Ru71]POX51142.1 NUDIX hydrolase [Streptomyces sp. Ru71]
MAPNEHEAKTAQPRMAAGALFFDSDGRVLMVEPTYKDYWDVPGGYVEVGESPLQAAVREVREELGISVSLGRLLAVDWAPNDAEGDKVLYLFDGGQLPPELLDQVALGADELRAFHFVPLADIEKRTIPRLARRIRSAAQARDDAAPIYLEHGTTPEAPAA